MSSYDPPLANADLIYHLRSLPMAGAVLHVGAHPDDEDSGTIAYLSRGRGVRTVYWSATRGEGGQNRQGKEKDEALGIARTWESLAAREVDGGEVLYGPFYDFGFSKTADGALSKWGRDAVIREIVRAIRMVQPQVVISRWSGGAGDGHGQHQAIGAVAEEAFEAAADPARFPELIQEGLPAWQAHKLYRSMQGDWQPGEDVTLGRADPDLEVEGVIGINAGEFDPVSGRTFQELAAIGRNRHRSQAMAEVPEPGDYFYYYGLVRSLVPVEDPEVDLFQGLDPTLTALAEYTHGDSSELGSALDRARSSAEAACRLFRPDEPEAAGEAVLQGLQALRDAHGIVQAEPPSGTASAALDRALLRKIGSFEDAAARCLGIRLECLVDDARVVPGQEIRVEVRLWCERVGRVEEARVDLRAPEGWAVRPRDRSIESTAHSAGGLIRHEGFEVGVPDTAEFSCPYWLRHPREPYRYHWPQGGPGGLPFDDPLVTTHAVVTVGPHYLTLAAPATSRETFVGGFRELSLAVLPPMALRPRETRVLVPMGDPERQVELQVAVRATQEHGAKGDLFLECPEGWAAEPQEVPLVFPRAGESQSIPFQLTIGRGAGPGTYRVHYAITSGHQRHGVLLQPVWLGAPGVPRPADETNCMAEAFVMAPAAVSFHLLDAAFIRTLRFGFVHGVEEEVLGSLARFGLDVTVLADEELAYEDLSSFDAIVIGPNAYLVRDGLRRGASRMLEYVNRGGTLIVQYQGYAYQAEGLAPYPIKYHQPHDRVTFPDARVEVLEPEHPILNLPNRISGGDFDGWVHERGLYFLGEWDRRYVPILECHDPGEPPQRGGMLVAAYGQGTFVYSAYSLFRQIPAGVPGAIRIFANLLGLAEARIRDRMQRARAAGLFSFMSEDQLHEVVRLMSERWFDDGVMLARQGEPGVELFLILEGEVEILKEGTSVPKYVAREGEAVGEMAILTDLPRSASLRAKGGLKVLSMQGEHFRRLMREHWDLTDGVIRSLAARLARG
jgi:LmbE family N-acetylglucosaminyl deacetylase